MTCPTCQTQTRVIDSRAGVPGETRRRHECKNGHRFTTIETVVNYIDARVCAETGLFGYANEYRALTAKANKKNASAYFCGHCERWHLTQAVESVKPHSEI
jgi:transcriptional regulator NrdR family protein